MKLVAHIEFDVETLEQLIEKQASDSGYVLHGAVTWDEDGTAHAQVRPMTLEEKEAAGLDTRDPIDVVTDAVISQVNTTLQAHEQRLAALVRKELQNTVKAVPQPQPPAARQVHTDKPQGIELVSPADYGLQDNGEGDAPAEFITPDNDEDEEPSRVFLDQLRKEQEEYPVHYSGGMVDEDGFVTLKR